jgi:transcriptional regulator with XRE-family HTH domain
MLTGAQVRMARAALNWGVRQLAAAAGVTPNTVSRFETGGGAQGSTLEKLEKALLAAGIEFIAENGGGEGVRFRKPRAER